MTDLQRAQNTITLILWVLFVLGVALIAWGLDLPEAAGFGLVLISIPVGARLAF